jgi:N-acetylmuramoyl-L-alanine amidase
VSNIHDQISSRIKAFAAELEELVKRAAIDAVTQSLGSGSGALASSAPSSAPRSAPRAAAASAPPAAKAPSRRASKGGKRPPEELAAMVTRAGDWIKSNPGHGVEDMAKAMSVQTKELALPIAKLLKSKTIKKRGQKRATKYYPG